MNREREYEKGEMGRRDGRERKRKEGTEVLVVTRREKEK